MPNIKNELKTSNIKYVGRDFDDLKRSLIQYAKVYYPNTYQDFNETSPGMMLLEMSAYVGDVLNFYIDQQYQEMLLPLAEEKRNLVSLSKNTGYKVKPISPAYVVLTWKQVISADANGKPNYNNLETLGKGAKVSSVSNPDLVFETIDVVDFKASGSQDQLNEITQTNASGLPLQYTFTRKAKAVSGQTKTKTIAVNKPTKFFKVQLEETNVIEVLSVKDSNGGVWYEVDNLAQDKIPRETHYTTQDDRTTAYEQKDGTVLKLPVPYSLDYIQTSKRYITETDENNKTSIIFGNGVLKNGQTHNSQYLAIEQVGLNIPGGEEHLNDKINPLLGDSYGTLGESPAYTTLTIEYRVGGGFGANVGINDLKNIVNVKSLPSGDLLTLAGSGVSVKNDTPALGGGTGETTEEIRQNSIANYSTQNRCVTKEDFEARILAMPVKFGNIAKVYVSRSGAVRNAQRQKLQDMVDRLKTIINKNYQLFDRGVNVNTKMTVMSDIRKLLDANKDGGLNPDDFNQLYEVLEMAYSNVTQDDRLYTVDVYLLSYDSNKQLVNTPNLIKQNLKSYIDNFRLLTDQITFFDGYVVNFGVVFDIVATTHSNKEDVRVRCIQAIEDHFSIDTMQFKQILYTNEVENLLMDVEGVKSVNYVTLTQDVDYNAGDKVKVFKTPLYNILINSDGTTSTGTNKNYGYYYDFGKFYGQEPVVGRGVVLPAYEPAVFELKNPKRNIVGIVR